MSLIDTTLCYGSTNGLSREEITTTVTCLTSTMAAEAPANHVYAASARSYVEAMSDEEIDTILDSIEINDDNDKVLRLRKNL